MVTVSIMAFMLSRAAECMGDGRAFASTNVIEYIWKGNIDNLEKILGERLYVDSTVLGSN
jgi:hypothetical protein